jgi:hypothetical protein
MHVCAKLEEDAIKVSDDPKAQQEFLQVTTWLHVVRPLENLIISLQSNGSLTIASAVTHTRVLIVITVWW